MLRSSEGRTHPAPRFLHAIQGAAIGLLALAIPGLAQAASVTFDVLDPSGYGATVTLEDGEAPGTLNIDIESFGPLATDPVGDILGVMIQGEAEAIFGLQASGADVDGVDLQPGDKIQPHYKHCGLEKLLAYAECSCSDTPMVMEGHMAKVVDTYLEAAAASGPRRARREAGRG